MPGQDQIDASRRIHRRTGRTFYLATRLLPERVRHATYVLYAFFRIADEVVDRTDALDPETQRAELERIRDAAQGDREPDDPVLSAFRDLREREGFDAAEVDAFVDAMAQDVETERYETYAGLEAYMRGSSVAVANMMMGAMGMPEDERETARPHAKALAEAFQLTNFLRDVREDVHDYGRVYLPQETLEQYDVGEADLAAARVTDGFVAAMRRELRRTEQCYRKGVAGIRLLPEGCQFGVLLAAVFYAEHHRLIRDRDYDVLTETPELGRIRRATLLARTWVQWRRHRDPEAVFYSVSDVSRAGESDAVPAADGASHRPA